MDNVVIVNSITELPYAYVPLRSLEEARLKYPGEKLYVYEQKYTGGKIIALPVVMQKPEGTNGR